MKTYTESELQELLRQQRELCDNAAKVKYSDRGSVGNIFPSYCYTVDHESILNAPSPLLPTEEVGIKEDDLHTGSCTIGNSIQQGKITSKNCLQRTKEEMLYERDEDGKASSWLTVYNFLAENGLREFFRSTKSNKSGIEYVIMFLESLLNSDKNAPVSDTTEADSSNADGNPKIPSIDWEGLEKDMGEEIMKVRVKVAKILKESHHLKAVDDVLYELYNNQPDFFKTNLQDYIK